ncbi:MAG TPA: hypothetical protein VMT88_02240, partial [Actinomycetes bacterium]|nr:hypothetical protein [Actinomycetes bacterium]
MTNLPVSRPSRGLVIWGVSLLVVAVVTGITGVVMLVARSGGDLATSLSSPVSTTPVSLRQELHAGTYLVYELTATNNRVGPLTTTNGHQLTVGPADVRVTGPDGTSVPVEVPTVSETVTRGNSEFTGAVRFVVTEPGTYQI